MLEESHGVDDSLHTWIHMNGEERAPVFRSKEAGLPGQGEDGEVSLVGQFGITGWVSDLSPYWSRGSHRLKRPAKLDGKDGY